MRVKSKEGKKNGCKEQKWKPQKIYFCIGKDNLAVPVSMETTLVYDKVLSELAVISKKHKELAVY